MQPVTGDYTAESEVGGQTLVADFSIDRSNQLGTTQIIDLEVETDQVTFQWTAPDDHLSFLVRVNPFPFDETVTGEIVVPGSQRHAVVDAALVPGRSYQAVVWGFSNDVETPGPIQSPFLLGSDSEIFEAPTLELEIHSVEFTQAIQEWQDLDEFKTYLQNNGEPPVPIVTAKPMAVRVYFKEVERLASVRVVLSGAASAQDIVTLQPGCTPEMSRVREGNCRSADLYFTPPSGVWSVAVEVFDLQSNQLDIDNFTMTSTDSDAMVLRAVRVCSERIENPSGSITWNCSPQERLGDLIGFLRTTMPTDDVSVEVTNHSVRREPTLANYDSNGNGKLDPTELGAWWGDIARDIDSLFSLFDRFRSLAGEQRYYYGMVRNDVPGVTGGVGLTPGRGAASRLNAIRLGVETNDEVVAHEVGHMLGRPHTDTGEPQAVGNQPPGCYNTATATNPPADWDYADNRIQSGPANNPSFEVGFDVMRRAAIDPQNNFDWMGYCTPRWIAPFTYREALDGLNPSILGSILAEDGEFWLVAGTLEGGNLELDPLFEFETTASTDPGIGPYRIDVLDAAGDTQFTRFFTPANPTTETTGEDGEVPPFFVELVPVQPAADEIIVRDPGGATIGDFELEGDAPEVTITAPAGGETISGLFDLTWDTVDPDSTSHTWRVQYSADGGAAWQSIGANLTEPSLTVNFGTLPGSIGQALVRVFASDGVNTGEGISNTFSVDQKLPSAEITFPEDGALFREGELVWLQGFAYDVDDGFLDGAALQWSSSLDGPLGSSAQLPITNLTAGAHQITMMATDSDGNTASDAIGLIVDATPPLLTLSAPPSLTARSCAVVSIDAQDEPGGSGLATLEYSLDGGDTWTAIEPQFKFVVPGVEQIHLIARAIDNAGNLSADERRYYFERECDDADLSVDKEGARDPAIVGKELAYTIWVTNHGPLTATEVQMTDELPDSVELLSVTQSQGSCAGENGTVSCELGDIAAGEWVTVDIVVKPTRPETITNTAAASSNQIDPDGSNNEASVSTAVHGPINSRVFRVRLSGENEVPPVETDERGLGAMILFRRGNELLYVINVRRPMEITSIHIHCGAGGANGLVGATLYDDGPTGRRAFVGRIVAPDDGNACGWTDLDTMITALRSGNTYINVHTLDNPTGEIRGQLEPVRNLWD